MSLHRAQKRDMPNLRGASLCPHGSSDCPSQYTRLQRPYWKVLYFSCCEREWEEGEESEREGKKEGGGRF